MSRCCKIVILAVAIILLVNPIVMAETFEWNLQVQENGSIHETVTTDADLIDEDYGDWQKTMGQEGTTYERVLANWEEYNQTNDGLPITAVQRNYLLFTTLALQYDDKTSQKLFEGIIHNAEGKIVISVPGIIKSTSAAEVDDLKMEPSAAWHVKGESEEKPLGNRPVILETMIFDGLLTAIIFIFIGVIGISIWYIRFVKRVNKIIEEEYSLTNIEEYIDENTENE